MEPKGRHATVQAGSKLASTLQRQPWEPNSACPLLDLVTHGPGSHDSHELPKLHLQPQAKTTEKPPGFLTPC